MPAPSSPSLSPRNPTNPQMRLGMCARARSQSKKHLRTPPRVMFCTRRGTLLNKASELCGRTGARAAVTVFSSKGKLYSSDDLSVEETAEIISDYVRCNVGAMPPMGPKEGVDMVKKEGKCFSNRFTTLSKKASELCTKTDARAAVTVFSNTGSLCAWGFPTVEDVISDWVEKQREPCVTKKKFVSLNLKCKAVMPEKLNDISGSGNSGVGVDYDSEVLNDDNFDSLLQSVEASCHILSAIFDEYVSDGLLTAPVNSVVASGSSGKEPMRSVFVGCEFNPHSSLNLSENNPSVNAGAGGHSGVGVGHDYEVLNDADADWLLSLLADNGNCNRNGGSYSFSTSPVNLADAGGSLGVESTSTLSDLEGREFVDSLFDFRSGLDENDCLIPRENSTVHGSSTGEEQGYGYNPDIFSTLEDLDVFS